MTDVLELGSDVWRAHAPGLGTVLIDPDGSLAVDLDAQAHAAAESVLVENWGEPLSCLRRGRVLVAGATLRDPLTGDAVLIGGSGKELAAIVVALAQRSWETLADYLAPVGLQGSIALAAPRSAGVIVGQKLALRSGFAVTSGPRDETTGVVIDVPRCRREIEISSTVLLSDLLREPWSTIESDLPAGLDRVRFIQSLLPGINHRILGERTVFAITAALAQRPMLRFGSATEGLDADALAERIVGWRRGEAGDE